MAKARKRSNEVIKNVERYFKIESLFIIMDKERVKELLEIELECITRADTCDRNCSECDLVQDTDELKAMYRWMIEKL